jgi:hypothetical protein
LLTKAEKAQSLASGNVCFVETFCSHRTSRFDAPFRAAPSLWPVLLSQARAVVLGRINRVQQTEEVLLVVALHL